MAAKYFAVRIIMTAISSYNETLFVLTEAPNWSENFGQVSQEDQVTVKNKIKIQKELTLKRKSRIQEKTKQLRVSHSKAVALDIRSGTGTLVFERYEKQISISRGSANIEPLSFGNFSGELNDEDQEFNADLDIQEDNNNEHNDNNQDESDSESAVDTGNSLQTSTPRNTGNRKVGSLVVPKLIDNKRKHQERNLSAAQRDQLFIKQIKSDGDFRKKVLQFVR